MMRGWLNRGKPKNNCPREPGGSGLARGGDDAYLDRPFGYDRRPVVAVRRPRPMAIPVMNEQVILVDPHDVAVGVSEKVAAHAEGLLHRAFSVFVFDARGRMLLQRRAASKYHSGGLWSNTCCSHPRPGETTSQAAQRRLREEMGFECALAPAFSFVYHANVGDGLVEHEFDHVFVGRFDGAPVVDPDEVDAWRWAAPAEILAELQDAPARFTHWFRMAMKELGTRGFLGAVTPLLADPLIHSKAPNEG
jgi:isopentenyl-diphosphate Delta-isomerase